MAWEKRRHGLYYYRSRRDGPRIIREYCGGGVTGEAAAQADQERRAARVRDRQEEQQRREVYESVRRNLESLHDEAAVVLDAVMAALGYYRHDRGKWRKRRAKATGRES